MAFTPEDGTGVTGANAYCSVADADSYFVLHRSSATWSAKTTTEKQTAILEATAWIDSEYRGMWVGSGILMATQGLSWPRTEAYDAEGRLMTGVPQDVVSATCELAIASFDAPLAAVRDLSKRVKRRKVGPIETEYETSGMSTGRVYPFVRSLLSGVSLRAVGSIPLMRV